MPWAHLDKLNSTNLNAKSGLVFNVKDEDYGASPSATAAVNTAAIQAAITAAGAVGGVVVFPQGTYESGVLSVTAANVTFQGAGLGSTVINFSVLGTGVAGLAISGDGFEAEGITFQGPGAATVYTATERVVTVTGASSAARVSGATFRKCRFTGGGEDGLRMQFVDNILVEGCKFDNCAYRGAAFVSCNVGTFRDNHIDIRDAVGWSGLAYGVTLSHISTDYDEDPNAGLPTADNPFCGEWSIADNVIEGPIIWEAIDTHGSYNVSITGNKTFASKVGILFTGASGDAGGYAGWGGVVSGNVCDKRNRDGTASGAAGGNGIAIGGSATPVTSRERVVITKNVLYGFGLSGNLDTAAINCRSANINFAVEGNIIDSWSGQAIYVASLGFNGLISGNVIGGVADSVDGSTGRCISIYGITTGNLLVAGNIHAPVANPALHGLYISSTYTGRVTCTGNDLSAATNPLSDAGGHAYGWSYDGTTDKWLHALEVGGLLTADSGWAVPRTAGLVHGQITDNPAAIMQLVFGDLDGSVSAHAIGSIQSTNEFFIARNAYQNAAGTDQWHQIKPSVASAMIRMNGTDGWHFYVAAAGVADGSLATFWGTAVASIAVTGAPVYALAGIPTAANNAAAATAGVAVGGFYRTNADPSVVCVRSA